MRSLRSPRRAQSDEEHVGGFDLVYENGFVDMDAKHRGWSSYLGAGVERGGTKGAKGRREGRGKDGGGEAAEQMPPTDKEKSEKERLRQLDTFSKHLQVASNKAKSGNMF